jgi:hypothetical protein
VIDFVVSVSDPTVSSRWGFEVTAEDASNNNVGTFTLVNTDSTQYPSGNTDYVSHTEVGNARNKWRVRWTAPDPVVGSITFYAAAVAGNGGGPSGSFTYTTSWPMGSLPVELSSFDVTLDGRVSKLEWRTESETGNVGFDVEHAVGSESFEFVGFVPGAGTTSEAHDYSYTINDLLPGTHRFRLRQIDLDGTTTVSEQIEVAVGVPDQFFLSDAYPNPFNPTTTFEFAVRQDQQVRVRVFDEMGRQVSDLFNGTLSANETHRVTFDAAGLASGTYIIQLQGANFSESRQVVLLK